MSHQPSTLDNVKDVTASALNTAVTTLNGTQEEKSKQSEFVVDEQGQPTKKGSFKDQLNAAAVGARKEEKQESYLQKAANTAANYIPGITTLQNAIYGQSEDESKADGKLEEQTSDKEALPKRTDHDVQIEEFIKTQYQSSNTSDNSKNMPTIGEDKGKP